MPIGLAYFTSAAASTTLIGVYSSAVLGARRRVVPVVAALAVMYTTRAIEWYALEIGRAAVTENPDE